MHIVHECYISILKSKIHEAAVKISSCLLINAHHVFLGEEDAVCGPSTPTFIDLIFIRWYKASYEANISGKFQISFFAEEIRPNFIAQIFPKLFFPLEKNLFL